MSNFQELMIINEKYNDKIKKFCNPLVNYFGVNQFSHSFINYSGDWLCMNLNLDWKNYFFCENLHLSCPFMRHPDNFENCVVFPIEIEDDNFKNIFEKAKYKYNVHLRLVIIIKKMDGVDFFVFGLNSTDINQSLILYNEICLIKLFIKKYKEEFNRYYLDFEDYKVNLRNIDGLSFDRMNVDLNYNRNIGQFLTSINYTNPPCLTRLEIRIMKELTKGLSSSMISRNLAISNKTVENYLDKMKDKLFCDSKSKLVQKARELELLGYLKGAGS